VTKDVLEFEITSTPEQLRPVRERVGGWVAGLGWAGDPVHDLVLAVDEALTNVIRHGYNGAPGGRICLRCAPVHDPARGAGVEVCIRDFGCQVDPQRICGRNLDDLRPGGLGVHIIRAMMDTVEYKQAEGGGMLLVMRKFKHQASPTGVQDK
jgi:serine/threonine-protein kinase RsbW